ncbi:MAG: chromosome segregation protein SMC [Deltaproteobacteria bacterium]|nr:chromosome segregation protein SMC [Deltaproteobacteria bacterium]
MRIRRLEICGFKSFADRALVRFGDGITGVVGPNGCGKSNIVDAIRWCMGEMSAKNLRGRGMQDVIFAGSESRTSMGMAEVALTFENDGNVPPQYAPLSEIEVMRRLHKDGTSEYLINKVQVRLRDVHDLFLGTGVGTRAYSIIEQGRIGFIVSARPEDRRTIIEEVAGITKFKARKKAALRRMEATEQNLLRVSDVVSELERQLGSLRRQAKRAERYKKLKEELRDLELHQATFDMLRLRGLELVNGQKRDTLEAALTDAEAVAHADEALIESERLALVEEERRLQVEQQSSAESDARLAGLERDLSHWNKALSDARLRAESVGADVADARKRIASGATERGELEHELASMTGSLSTERGQIEALAATATRLQAEIASLDGRAEALRRDAVEQVHHVAQQKSHVVQLERHRTELWERIAQGENDRETETECLHSAEAQQTELTKSADERRAQIEEWRRRQGNARGELARLVGETTAGDARVLDLKGQLATTQSRLESLQLIARRMEGYSEGVRTLMRADDGSEVATPEPAVAGIDALVADILVVEPCYEKAIEAALAERLQCVIVDSQKSGAKAIDYLKGCTGGRGSFIPRAPRLPPQTLGVVPHGVVGPAQAFVTVRDGYSAVARYLFADVLIVDSLATAMAIWETGAGEHTLVTLDGEVIDAAGTVTGGSDSGAGLLAKRREMRELEGRAAELDLELKRAMALQEKLVAARLQLEVDLQQLDKDIHATELEAVEVGKDLEATVNEITRLKDRIEVLGYELATRREDLARIDQEQAIAKSAAEHADGAHRDIETELAAANEARRKLVVALDIETAALTNAKVALASREQRQQSLTETLTRLRATDAELCARVERGDAAIDDDSRLVAELEGRLQDGKAHAASTVFEAQKRREALATARLAYEAKREAITAKEQATRGHRRQAESIRAALAELKLEVQRLELEWTHLCQQVRERHDVDLLRVAGDYHMRTIPSPEAAEHRAELDRAIKNIGPINLTAIEECAEIENRHAFLARQRDDLQSALESLKRAIQRINRASRERFQEAFTAVNEMFQKVFPRLFCGGEARLELSETEDLLEAGVEIVAQPPGKKLQSVGLLSGGEKALTATALVFSIFLIKPSPFCVLDEVDAPLDDANVGRFNDMLREIAKISQFIVITHNKNTMTEADRLFGITMEEPGLSKVVSVDLRARAEKAA